MKPAGPSESSASGVRRAATVLESVDEIRSIARHASTVQEPAPTTNLPPGQVAVAVAAEPFRPTDRPPMALLTVHDDGDDSGEQFRLRAGSFVIGRVEGDLVIPHDGGISGRHAEIVRRAEGGQFRWYLRDLKSTNGTFVRAANVTLHADQEVMIGRARFRYEVAGREAPPVPEPVEGTRHWQALSPRDLATLTEPSLVEQTPQGEGRRFPLRGTEVWIGREAGQCSIVLNDPTVGPRHARASLDAKYRWVLENARSVNGLWVRVQEVHLERGGQFQCGEQRFSVKIL